MKHKGAVMEYSKERLADLMRAYRQYITSCSHISMPQVYQAVVSMPSRRFWVSDIRAALVISAIMRGENPLAGMRPLKREMYSEIHSRVIALRKLRPELSVSQLCAIVISQPAPKFYLTPGSAKMIICKEKKRWMRERLKKLRFLS